MFACARSLSLSLSLALSILSRGLMQLRHTVRVGCWAVPVCQLMRCCARANVFSSDFLPAKFERVSRDCLQTNTRTWCDVYQYTKLILTFSFTPLSLRLRKVFWSIRCNLFFISRYYIVTVFMIIIYFNNKFILIFYIIHKILKTPPYIYIYFLRIIWELFENYYLLEWK